GFAPSGQQGFQRRAASALYRTFIVPGRDGNELAFPRIAAAFGTVWVAQRWHPWQETAPAGWTQAGWILARYVARSYWAEFKPEIGRAIRKASGIVIPR